jgi:HD-like signal output (HDOD) protein
MSNYARHLNNLPVNPNIAAKVLALAEKQDFSYAAIEEVISRDPGLTTRILKIANSALYARQSTVTRLQSAITLLGINTIKNLVILVTGSSLFSRNLKSPFYSLFWRHSLATAFLARDLAGRSGVPEKAEEAFVAGLLHNIGQVALFLDGPAAYEELLARARREDRRIGSLEEEAYGTDHKRVGNEVLSLWSFPAVYRDAALEHGNDNVTSSHKQVVILVTVADFIASNWYFLADAPKPLGLVAPWISWLGQTEAGLEAWQAELRARLEADRFYAECQKLVRE